MNTDLIEALLYQPESPSLDFKAAAYPFAEASDEQKSELLKDILAFLNSWRIGDAYIVMGVRTVSGGQHEVVGIEADPFDDAHLQQFVKGQTNRTPVLSYSTHSYEGKRVGIITIPKQDRPTYATRTYGKVQKELVYYRQGSSTAVAKPEDIAKMGRSDYAERTQNPVLELQFADRRERKMLGRSCVIESTLQKYDEAGLPDYGYTSGSGVLYALQSSTVNPDYWREWAGYISFHTRFCPVGFLLKNLSTITATGVRVEIQGDNSIGIACRARSDEPRLPKAEWDILSRVGNIPTAIRSDVDVEQHGESWTVTLTFGKVQPKQTVWLGEDLLVGGVREGQEEVKLTALVYGDNLSDPTRVVLTVDLKASLRELTIEDVARFTRSIGTDEDDEEDE